MDQSTVFLIFILNLIAVQMNFLNKSIKPIDFACEYSFDCIPYVLIRAIPVF